jgi:hypothetical protein
VSRSFISSRESFGSSALYGTLIVINFWNFYLLFSSHILSDNPKCYRSSYPQRYIKSVLRTDAAVRVVDCWPPFRASLECINTLLTTYGSCGEMTSKYPVGPEKLFLLLGSGSWTAYRSNWRLCSTVALDYDVISAAIRNPAAVLHLVTVDSYGALVVSEGLQPSCIWSPSIATAEYNELSTMMPSMQYLVTVDGSRCHAGATVHRRRNIFFYTDHRRRKSFKSKNCLTHHIKNFVLLR